MTHNIARIGKAGDLIDGLNREYDKGNIEVLCVCLKTKDGKMYTTWTEGNFVERLGMSAVLTSDMIESARTESLESQTKGE